MARNKVSEKFDEFYETWLKQLESYVQIQPEIANSRYVTDQQIIDLAANMTQHYKDYFSMKWNLASEDVLSFYTASWINPLENSYYWHTGWKPSMIFKLIQSTWKTKVPGSSLATLTEGQLKEIEALRVRVRIDEMKIEMEMERNQVALAERKMVELAKLVSRNKGIKLDPRFIEIEETLLKAITIKLEKTMRNADIVRLKTLKGILDVLSPIQSVDFLAGISLLILRIRQWGERREFVCGGSSSGIGGSQGVYNLAAQSEDDEELELELKLQVPNLPIKKDKEKEKEKKKEKQQEEW